MLDLGTRNNSIIRMTIFEHSLYSSHCTRYFHMSFLHPLKLIMQE